ncbi:3455_t:CDS:2, partial [Gigaspora margarita]
LNFVIEMQMFLSIPKFNKKLLYPDANTLYQHFINTFAYNQMVLTTNPSLSKPKLVEKGDKKCGPDENSKHLKNIIEYCKLFHFLDLDYLTVHIYTPGQSSFNPVERGMAPLLSKLARIVLPIDHYGTHLNS